MKDNSVGSVVLKNLKIVVAGKDGTDKVELQIEELNINSTMAVDMEKGEYDATMSFAKELVQTTGVITNALIDKRHAQRLELIQKRAELGVDDFGHATGPKYPAAKTS